MQKNFYRKYRPKKFNDIYGQDKIVTILKEQINREKTHFAYLFTGIQGVGKTSTARILAKTINCLDNEMGEACQNCKICILNKEYFLDIYEIDAASNNGVEQIRNLREKALISPSKSKKKIYIIDEVHMLSKSAYNAFLKLLEEPPHHIVFILATTQLFKIPQTILSRCQIFEFHPLSNNTLTELLIDISEKEGILFKKEALELIAKKTKGSVRQALNILEQATFLNKDRKITISDLRNLFGMTDDETINQLIISLIKKDKKTSLETLENLVKKGIDLKVFYLSLIDKLIEIISNKFSGIKIKEEFFNKISIQEFKNILDIFVDKYSELANLNLLQILKLIILDNFNYLKESSQIIKKEFSKNITSDDNNEEIKEIKVSILKSLYILKNRNKDLFELIKILWNSIESNLEHDIFGGFAELLNKSRIISASENEVLIKVNSEAKRNKLNFLKNNESYQKFIKKILEKDFKIFVITNEEAKALREEYNKIKNNEK